MKIPILNGIYATENSNFRTAYPINMMPVPKQTGINNGYLRPVYGIVSIASGFGADRGAYFWKGSYYRVMGTSLLRIDSSYTVTTVGTVPGSDEVTFSESFDYMSICADGKLYYWSGTSLTQVTDVDLGTCVDSVWVDGYFMFTDGEYIGVTELNDPLSINPLKYGSSEADPDVIKSLLVLRGEPVALNRYTIEYFENIGGNNFPFARIKSAQIMKGVVGRDACCIFADAIAFVGSARNETPSVYIGANGDTIKISTDEIDSVLKGYTEQQLSTIVLSKLVDKSFNQLHIELPDRTLVYDLQVSKEVGEPVWFFPSSSLDVNTFSKYRARNIIWCYDRWQVADTESGAIGYLNDTTADHWGDEVAWQFITPVIYGEGNKAIINRLELVGLPGRSTFGEDSTVWTSYSVDGESWSMEKSRQVGLQGQRDKRIVWMKNGMINNYRIQKFRGTSSAMMSVARLEADIELLVDGDV